MSRAAPPLSDQDHDFLWSTMDNLPQGDPVLVCIWNEERLAAASLANADHTKQNIINRLIQNGASDPNNSKIVFFFPSTGDIQTAREDFLRNANWCFGTAPEMQRDTGVPRQPVAETYLLSKITRDEMDYANARFFYY